SSPADLVREVVAAGIVTMAVTDHDTTAAVSDVTEAAGAAGIDCIAGIEITAVVDGRDMHILGYFVDPRAERLNAFLSAQRDARRRRVSEIADRLDRIGAPIDAAPLVAAGRSLG